MGVDAHFFVDEAAHYAQIDLVADGTWVVDRPFADQDPEGVHAPMDRARLSGADEYAPFVNHPLSVWIGVAADTVGGRFAVRIVSVLGAVGAAAAAAALAMRFRPGSGPLALWLTGAVSPLLFDSQLIVAHTLGAAVVGGAAVWWVGSRRPAALVGAGLFVAGFVAVMLRSEAMLLVGAVALVVTSTSLVRRDRARLFEAMAVVAGGGLAYVLEPAWIRRIIDAPDVAPRTIAAGSRGGLEGRIDALQTVVLKPSYEGLTDPLTDVLLVLAVVLLGVGVVLAVRGRIDLARMSFVAAVVATGLRLADPGVTPGILLAFPPLVIGVVLVGLGVHRPRGSEAVMVAVAGVFAGAVAVTQYRGAGGFEWGWRYVAIALPLVVPTIAVALMSLRDRIGPRPASQTVGAVILVSVLVALSGLLEQRAVIDRTDLLRDRLESEAAGVDHLLFLDPLLGRAMWQLSLSGVVVESEVDDAAEVLSWMRDAGDDAVLVVWVGGGALPIDADPIGSLVELGVSDLRAIRVSP